MFAFLLVIFAFVFCAPAAVSNPRSELCEFLLLTEDQGEVLRATLIDLDEKLRPEGFVFLGSRAHKLWRSAFDVDVSLIGLPQKNDSYRSVEGKEDWLRYITSVNQRLGIHFDVLSSFERMGLRELIETDRLVHRAGHSNLMKVSLEIWNNHVEAHRLREGRWIAAVDDERCWDPARHLP